MTQDNYQLSNQPQFNEDSFTQCLKQAYQDRIQYSRLSHHAIVALDPIETNELSSEYVAEYKNTSNQLPTHIFKLTNHAYLHMRRTGIDQSILLNGENGSGKAETFKNIMHHLIQLSSSPKKSRLLQDQITGVQTIIDAFGGALFGRYIELQFNQRGRMVGLKLLNYLLDTSNVISNFRVFYYLLNGVSNEERSVLQLEATEGNQDGEFDQLKQALQVLGINKKHQARIWQLLACILHLAQLEFMDGTDKETPTIKNPDILSLCADFMGTDPRALEDVLTYKSQIMSSSMVATVILDAKGAACQRDDMIKSLYSLLFTYLVEHINSKLSLDMHNFIGILDLPSHHQQQASFDDFCVNLANERFHTFCQQKIFDIEEYRMENVAINEVPYFSNQACIDLLLGPKQGLVALINQFTPEGKDADVLEAFKKHHGAHASFHSKNNQFSIQHFNNQVAYTSTGFIEANQNTLNPDLVHLIRGGATPPSYNSFMLELFKNVPTQSHPKQTTVIMNAQQTNMPLRRPSKRSKQKSKDVDNHHVLARLTHALDDLFSTLDETLPWFVFCIKPYDQFDSVKVRAQVRAYGLPQIAQQACYSVSYPHEEFIQRYAFPAGEDVVEQCKRIVLELGWDEKQVAIGETKIYLEEITWQTLETKLRLQEKQDQKQVKDEKRIQENMASLGTPAMPRDHSTDTLSQLSYASNTEFLSTAHRIPQSNSMVFTEDQRSFYSSSYNVMSSYNGSHVNLSSSNISSNEVKENIPVKEEEEETEVSATRKNWLRFVWFMTWWVPTPFLVWCGKMKRHDIQIAWREKFTLCLCILFTSLFVIWFLVFFGELVCPHQDVFSISELQSHKKEDNAYVAIRGEVFDLTKFAPHHWASQVIPEKVVLAYGGTDASSLFPVQVSALCQGVTGNVSPYVSLDYNSNLTDTNAQYHNFLPTSGDPRPDWYFEQMAFLRKNYKLGSMGYTPKDISNQATGSDKNDDEQTKKKKTRQWAILNNNVYDLTSYILGGRRFDLPQGMAPPANAELNFLDTSIVSLFSQMAGQDITKSWNALPLAPEMKRRQEVCLHNLYFVGRVDERNSVRCLFAEYLLLIVTIFLCLVIVFKFLAALQFRTWREPEKQDKFVICQVPCYTEGEEELKKTIDSIAALQYDDKRKLIFIICDGMIIGGGNDRPTPQIVLDILGVTISPEMDPEPLSFFSVGEGQKQHNMGKVYSGLYECQGHVVPYIVVSKVGKPSERQKPGNRGKRDSQLILMNFLNKIHFNAPMSPMELELYHQIKNVIGVNPAFYEFVLMVDADTEVMSDGLNRMVSAFAHDSKIIGLCGETVLSNEKESWVTMIQVYEYFISHYMIKAFESLFGSVTCLPGCFCMYRIRSPQKNNQPLLISNQIIEDYSINKVDTLHKKNLLHLGEDRYLTTLILKHFPTYKTKFVSDAKCATNAPDQWSVLLSQRRRWINSTIHNLGELVFLPQLCGFCCFSMRFVVMLDLFSTLVQPAIVGYLIYLIYTLAKSTTSVPLMSIVTIAGVYGLQALIFLLHKKWEHIIWMIVSAFAIPVFSFAIPIYAYWHFDDFSWGNTRVVMGDKGKKHLVMADEGKFDKKSIPVMTWEDHEKSVLMYTDAFDDAASYQSTQTRPYAQSVHSFSRGPSPAFTNYGYGYPAYPSPSPPPGHFRAQSPFH